MFQKVSWNDVGLSEKFVQKYLRSIDSENGTKFFHVSYLVHYLIFHNRFKSLALHTCIKCKFKQYANNEYESLPSCSRCDHKIFSVEKQIQFKCRKDYLIGKNIRDLIIKMQNNIKSYFNVNIRDQKDVLRTQWNSDLNLFEVEFVGLGEKVFDRNLNYAIIKASFLCPFLWDSKFDFTTEMRYKNDASSFIMKLMMCNIAKLSLSNNIHLGE